MIDSIILAHYQFCLKTKPYTTLIFVCFVFVFKLVLFIAGKDSMIVTAFRLFNRKRFSQRTNDMRIRSILDYLAGTTGSENADFLLFSRLIGLQPKQTNQPRPGKEVGPISLLFVEDFFFHYP